MRTKALLCLAALAVSAATAVAQSNVYSLNIVGYVNVDVIAGMNLLSVPLKPSDGNTQITNTIVLNDAMDSAQIFKWGGTGWATTSPSWIAGEGWDASVDIPVGEAFFLKAPVAGKITFVGEVITGPAVPYTLNPGMNFVANKAPVDEAFPGKDVGNDSDVIFTWGGNTWNNETWTYIAGEGWSASAGTVGDAGPVLKAGNGIAYNNTGPKIDWTRDFTPD